MKRRKHINRKHNRKAKALAAAKRQSYVGLAIGAAVGAVALVMAFSTVPRVSPKQLAALLKGQSAHAAPIGEPSNTTAPQTNPTDQMAPAMSPVSELSPSHKTGYRPLGFDTLASFPYFITDQMVDGTKDAAAASLKTLEQIPIDIRGLDQSAIAIQGFMLPIKYADGLTPEFLLLRNQSLCCYGVAPKITEWVTVRTRGKGVKPILDVPVTVCGTLHVGEVREQGDLVGIYRLEADQVKGPE